MSKIVTNTHKRINTLTEPTALMAWIKMCWSETRSPPTVDITTSILCSFRILSINPPSSMEPWFYKHIYMITSSSCTHMYIFKHIYVSHMLIYIVHLHIKSNNETLMKITYMKNNSSFVL